MKALKFVLAVSLLFVGFSFPSNARTTSVGENKTGSICVLPSSPEPPTRFSKVLAKVNSRWPTRRSLIALHSPNARIETGLRLCPPEKSQDRGPFATDQSVFCSPVSLGIIAKYGHFPGISDEEEPIFSAVQTAWRRGRDSNPRYRC